MRLTELEPEWVCGASPTSHTYTDNFAEAQGIIFACPYHFQKNGGLVGTHMVLIWFIGKGVPDECRPLPRWSLAGGDSFENVTITPSINLAVNNPEEWHGWVTGGEVT